VGLFIVVVMAVAACGVGVYRIDAAAGTSGPPSEDGPPTGTLKPLVSPPRSFKPVFTGEAARVERAFRARVSAFDHQDVVAALATFSRTAPLPKADDLRSFMHNYLVRLFRINAIGVQGDSATIDYENAIVGRNLRAPVNTLLAQHEVWTREDGTWKGVSDVATAPGIPADVATVSVTLRDGRAPEVGPRPNRDFAFKITNTGAAPKGVFILGIPRHIDAASLLPVVARVGDARAAGSSAPFPRGVLELGATPDVAAQSVGTMVFSDRLPKGRYLLLARAGGDPHPVLDGEYVDFTVR
jgi:hypothetical protein